jgi:hypothetical protein
MRLFLIAFLASSGLWSAAAQARDCRPPEITVREVRGLRDFADCLIAEIADLRRENTRLAGEVTALQKALARIPGEIVNEGGRASRLGGDDLARASFSATARSRAGAVVVGVDPSLLQELCATGCALSLSLSAIGLRTADPAPVVAVGPCTFVYNAASGAWSRSSACGEALAGIDGDGQPTGATGGEVVAEAGAVCLLADSEPSRKPGTPATTFARDSQRGLFLIADPSLWTGTETRFRCDLKLLR